ncbi:MAG: GNAT family N-acetyltransferase, partial [Defluviitaleaceae bacterium]|nr:GNAT family N-acetyltransferase [Defluviitaleaceae bacterium]
TNMRAYELTEVNPDINANAALRSATEQDLSFYPYWVEGAKSEFDGTDDPKFNVSADIEAYRHRICGNLFFLEINGAPVSTAVISRELGSVCNIGMVYTPPYLRGRGYATDCVAAVTRVGLARGYKKCTLYTDLSNPTSNSIYMKIGYKPVFDASEIDFE